jgi:hypothetical protein
MADDGDPRPEAVDAAAAWLEENRSRYTRDALFANLQQAGFTATEIGLAEDRLGIGASAPGPGSGSGSDPGLGLVPGPAQESESGPAAGSGRDLRRRAATILILGTLATWALVVVFFWIFGSQPERSSYESASWLVVLGGGAIGVCLLVVLMVSLLAVGLSDRLRRGAEGALVAILAVPFILIVILAGLCVGPFVGR